MFVRIVKESLVRKRRRKLIAVAAVALGATVVTAMLNVALGIGDDVNRELRSYGANIEVLPRDRSVAVTAGGIQYQAAAPSSYINEKDLPDLKSIFWSNNILAFAPFINIPASISPVASGESGPRPLDAMLIGTWFDHSVALDNGQQFVTGVRAVSPWWKVDGEWPADGECLIGSRLADRAGAKIGQELSLQTTGVYGSRRPVRLKVAGILSTGQDEDQAVVTSLKTVQQLAGLDDKVERVEVSALTNPDDQLAHRDPAKLTPAEYERWSCTPYVFAVAKGIQDALPGSEAHAVLRVSNTEGTLLKRVNLMLLLIAIAALAAAVLGVSSTMMTTVLERRNEIGLLKAIGASNLSVTSVFLAEAMIVAIVGGSAGIGLGYGLAQIIAHTVFSSSVPLSGALVPVILALSLVVALAGSAVPLRAALRFEPSVVLRSE